MNKLFFSPSRDILFLFIIIGFATLTGSIFWINEFIRNKEKNSSQLIEENTIKEKNRDISLDIAKILSAFFVVLIHTSVAGYEKTFGSEQWKGFLVLNTVSRFAVPVFMFVSGTLMLGKSEYSLKKALKKSVKAFILLLIYNVFYCFLQHALWGNAKHILREIVFIPIKTQFSGHLWYGYFLVSLYLFSPILQSLYISLSNRLRIYFIAIAFLIPSILDLYSICFTLSSATLTSFSMYMTLSYIGLLLLGRLIYEKVIKLYSSFLLLLGCLLLFIGFLITLLLTFQCSIKTGKAFGEFLPENKLFTVCYATGIFILLLSQKNKVCNLPMKLKKIIIFISERSLGIYFLHCAVIWIFGKNLILHGIKFNSEQYWYDAFLFAIINYLITLLLVIMFSKIPILKKIVM